MLFKGFYLFLIDLAFIVEMIDVGTLHVLPWRIMSTRLVLLIFLVGLFGVFLRLMMEQIF